MTAKREQKPITLVQEFLLRSFLHQISKTLPYLIPKYDANLQINWFTTFLFENSQATSLCQFASIGSEVY